MTRTELRPVSPRGFTHLVGRVLARSAPRARVIAMSQVHLGAPLDVDWWLFWSDAPERTVVTVALVGTEVAHRRISARTGISVATQTRPFVSLEIDRQDLDPGGPVASGHGEVLVPARSVPSLAGRFNEIAWAVIVEASGDAGTLVRQAFPLAVLPVER